MKISEARLNDWCYILFKQVMGMPPRECDIRICMDMSAPDDRIHSASQAILMPDEVAGKSHTIAYDVDPIIVFDAVTGYIEDHWIKEELEQQWKDEALRVWTDEMVPDLMKVKEEDCAKEG